MCADGPHARVRSRARRLAAPLSTPVALRAPRCGAGHSPPDLTFEVPISNAAKKGDTATVERLRAAQEAQRKADLEAEIALQQKQRASPKPERPRRQRGRKAAGQQPAAEAMVTGRPLYTYSLDVDPSLFGRLRVRCWAKGESRPSPYSEEVAPPPRHPAGIYVRALAAGRKRSQPRRTPRVICRMRGVPQVSLPRWKGKVEGDQMDVGRQLLVEATRKYAARTPTAATPHTCRSYLPRLIPAASIPAAGLQPAPAHVRTPGAPCHPRSRTLAGTIRGCRSTSPMAAWACRTESATARAGTRGVATRCRHRRRLQTRRPPRGWCDGPPSHLHTFTPARAGRTRTR